MKISPSGIVTAALIWKEKFGRGKTLLAVWPASQTSVSIRPPGQILVATSPNCTSSTGGHIFAMIPTRCRKYKGRCPRWPLQRKSLLCSCVGTGLLASGCHPIDAR